MDFGRGGGESKNLTETSERILKWIENKAVATILKFLKSTSACACAHTHVHTPPPETVVLEMTMTVIPLNDNWRHS